MSIEELQQKYDRLLEKTRRVRGVQKEYFKYRLGKDLDLARRLERELDQLIAEEVKVKESKQPEIPWKPIQRRPNPNDLSFD